MPERKYPDCNFCRLHGKGETIAAYGPMFTRSIQYYGPITYCPMCGAKLKVYATLDGMESDAHDNSTF